MSIRKISESNIASKTLKTSPFGESGFVIYGSGSFSTSVPYAFRWTNSGGIGTQYAAPAQTITATFLETTNVNPTNAAVGFGTSGGSELAAIFAFNRTTGFGTKYTIPAGIIRGAVAWSSDNKVVTFGSSTTDMSVYQWNDTTGVGTKFTNPSSFMNFTTVRPMAINTTLKVLAVAGNNTSPYLHAWSFDTTTGFGAKFANPSTLPGGGDFANFSGFNQTGNAIVIPVPGVNPRIYAVAVTSSGFGTKYADPSPALAQGNGSYAKFNKTGEYIAITGDSSPYQSIYRWTDASGFGTRFANPSSAITNPVYEAGWSSDSKAVTFVRNISGSGLYAWSDSGYGARYSNPSASGFTTTLGVSFENT